MNTNNIKLKFKRYFHVNIAHKEKSRKLIVLNNLKYIFFVGKGVTPRIKFMKYVEKLRLTKKKRKREKKKFGYIELK